MVRRFYWDALYKSNNYTVKHGWTKRLSPRLHIQNTSWCFRDDCLHISLLPQHNTHWSCTYPCVPSWT